MSPETELFHHPPVQTRPFIEREMRVAWRQQNPVKLRFWLAAGGFAASLFFMLFNPGRLGTVGSEMHKLLCWIAIILIFQVPRTTAGLFADDRRNDTLGLIFLSGIRPGEFFVGKLLGTALVAFTHLLGLFPFLAIAFLVGGVSIKLFVATLVCLPLLLLFAFAVSTLASVLADDDSAALFLALALGGVICLAAPVGYWANGIFSDVQTLSRDWLTLSPAFPAFVVVSGLGGGTAEQFWAGCGMTLVWSLVCLSVAGAVVMRVWRDRPSDASRPTWRTRWQAYWRGDSKWRRGLTERWLESHPFTWLASRDRRLVNLAWLVVVVVMTLWVAACWCWPQRWPGTVNFLLTCVVLNLTLHWLTLFAAGKTIGDHRVDGSLELLLTTPLEEAAIVQGQLLALRDQFRPVALSVIGIELVMMAAGFMMRQWTWLAAVIYVTIWASLIVWTAWYAGRYQFVLTCFWDSLVCGRPMYAIGRRTGSISMWLLWALFMFGRKLTPGGRANPTAFPEGTYVEMLLVGVGVICVVIQYLKQKEKHREQLLISSMRQIAEEPPPEPSDPRFKHWESGEPFPPHPQHRLVESAIQAEQDKTLAK